MRTYKPMDPADALLSRISKTYAAKVANKRFVTKLALANEHASLGKDITDLYMPWRDAEEKDKKSGAKGSGVQKRKTKSKSSQAKKRKVLTREQREDAAAKSKDEAVAAAAMNVWSKEQREQAMAKKRDDAEAAAQMGVRMSGRARVPSQRVLNPE